VKPLTEDKNKKVRTSLWMDTAVLAECDANLQITDCRNRSEYIQNAVLFYNGYVHSQNKQSLFTGRDKPLPRHFLRPPEYPLAGRQDQAPHRDRKMAVARFQR